MTDANRVQPWPEAIRRARTWRRSISPGSKSRCPPTISAPSSRSWRLAHSVPIAVGESLYSISQFKDYLQAHACSIVQVDVARIGGITPWLKVAHMAEAFNVPVCPHFLMELHVGLCCAVPNSRWVDCIPQLDTITPPPSSSSATDDLASEGPGWASTGIGIAIARLQAAKPIVIGRARVVDTGIPYRGKRLRRRSVPTLYKPRPES